MKFSASAADPLTAPAACLVIGVFQGKKPTLSPTGAALDRAAKKTLSAALGRGGLSGQLGGAQMLYHPPGLKAARVLLVGLGPKPATKRGRDNSASPNLNLRRAANLAAKFLDERGITSAAVCLLDGDGDGGDLRRGARDIAEGMADALYRFDQTKSGESKPRKFKRAQLLCARAQLAAVKRGLREGQAVADGVNRARDYANLPGNLCTPSFLADEAVQLGKAHGIGVTVLDEAAMEKLKMGALLSVSRGSREEAKLIVMEYRGAGDGKTGGDGDGKSGDNTGDKKPGPVVLVGKGLTFDAGGISLKPAAAMDEMKFDMCGGAAVFGALQAAAELALPLDIIGLVPCSENLPDGAANKPGDIVTSMAGTTIEILNTDAEGRLILCDALTYAERFQPSAVVDIATLTGACAVALGAPASGLFSDSDALADALLAAGEASGDRAWRLPVWDDYAKQLKSNFADLANIGGRYAGAVTAACFLKHFTAKFDWAHLDIAGSAWKSGAAKGATGRPVPLLVEFLLGRAAANSAAAAGADSDSN